MGSTGSEVFRNFSPDSSYGGRKFLTPRLEYSGCSVVVGRMQDEQYFLVYIKIAATTPSIMMLLHHLVLYVLLTTALCIRSGKRIFFNNPVTKKCILII